jgi:dienelactone hydrolase
LQGLWSKPSQERGVIVFPHSAAGRFCPCYRIVAEAVRHSGLGALLVDLLTEPEIRSRANIFHVELLATRLAGATDWARQAAGDEEIPVGYFGECADGATALIAASRDPRVGAVVCRNARPDLARHAVEGVRAPTLLLVSRGDRRVLEHNRAALELLHAAKRLTVLSAPVRRAEEARALEEVAGLALEWFLLHLPKAQSSDPAPPRYPSPFVLPVA